MIKKRKCLPRRCECTKLPKSCLGAVPHPWGPAGREEGSVMVCRMLWALLQILSLQGEGFQDVGLTSSQGRYCPKLPGQPLLPLPGAGALPGPHLAQCPRSCYTLHCWEVPLGWEMPLNSKGGSCRAFFFPPVAVGAVFGDSCHVAKRRHLPEAWQSSFTSSGVLQGWVIILQTKAVLQGNSST